MVLLGSPEFSFGTTRSRTTRLIDDFDFQALANSIWACTKLRQQQEELTDDLLLAA